MFKIKSEKKKYSIGLVEFWDKKNHCKIKKNKNKKYTLIKGSRSKPGFDYDCIRQYDKKY